MSERAPYSRVYWTIPDDPKFVGIYSNDNHFAAWTRLLLIADQAYPASAHLPSSVKRASVKALADTGLIDLLTGSRYRIHGLEDERARRRLAATSRGVPKPPTRGPDGTRPVARPKPTTDPTGSATTGLSRAEDEPSQAEPTRADDDPFDEPEYEARVWLSKHGCHMRPGDGYHQKLILAVERHGINAMVGMLDRLSSAGTKDGDIKGFLFGAMDALDARTRPNLHTVEREERDEERAEARRNRKRDPLLDEIAAAIEARERAS